MGSSQDLNYPVTWDRRREMTIRGTVVVETNNCTNCCFILPFSTVILHRTALV